MQRTVGEVASIAGVSVRTLHHYDEIGLVRPADRSAAGYRLYDDADLERLVTVLAYREAGLPLEVIAELLADGRTPAWHLREQRRALLAETARLAGMVAAIDRMLEAEDMGQGLTPEEKLELFGEWGAREEEYASEAAERWGESEAFETSRRRTAGYTKHDWERIKEETGDVERRVATALSAGVAPDSERGMTLAEEHRAVMARWFYDVSPEMHLALGRMYVEDPRFTAYYEEHVGPGAAVWLRDAIAANSMRRG